MTDLRAAHELLGLRPGADAEAIAAAYRARAKALHPDRTGDEKDAARMAAVTSARDVLVAALGRRARAAPSAGAPAPTAPRGRRRPGDWLPEEVRRTLGAELVVELSDGERVDLVLPASTWASPHTVLVATDRRLVWLLDDAVAGRVRSLRYTLIEDVRATRKGRRRPTSTLRVRPRSGRPVSFAELPVDAAADLARRITAAAGA